MKVLLNHNGADGNGGYAIDATREAYALCRRHGLNDLYDRGLTERWGLDRFRSEVLKAIGTTGHIAGLPVNDASAPESRTREGILRSTSLGDLVSSSEAFRAYLKTSGQIKHASANFENLNGIRDLSAGDRNRATLLTTGLTNYQRPPGIIELGVQPLTIAQLFAQGETSAAVVRAIKETSFTNSAAAVAEEGQKPEATWALEETDFPTRKIAVFTRVSDEMLADFPAVKDYLNTRLGYSVQAKEDSELLNGTGADSRIRGVMQTSGIGTLAYAAAGGNCFDRLAKCLNAVRDNAFVEPDAIVMNSTDFQNFRLTKNDNGDYYLGGPGEPTPVFGGYSVAGIVWGKPVIVSTSIAQGTALVGAFRLGAQLFRRMGLTLEMTNSDQNDFQYNRTAIRCETRLALAVYRPQAFATLTGIPDVN